MFKKKKQRDIIEFLTSEYHVPDSGKLITFKGGFEWQKKVLQDVFNTKDKKGRRQYHTCLISCPRQQGKGIISQACMLYALVCLGRNLNIYAFASDKDQAALVPLRLQRAIMLNESLSSILDYTKDEIHCKVNNNTLHVMSSDKPSSVGLIADVVVWDELSMETDNSLYSLVTPSMSSRAEPLLIAMSTAGAERQGPWYDLLEIANKELDPHVYLYHTNERLSPLTNEAFIASQKLLLTPAQFARQYENLITDDQTFLTTEEVAACIEHREGYPIGMRKFVGVDYGIVKDRAVVASVIKESEDYYIDEIHTWQGSRKSPVQLNLVVDCVRRLCSQQGNVESILFDRWQSISSVQQLVSEGLPAKERPITSSSRPQIFKNLLSIIRDQRLHIFSTVLDTGCFMRDCQTCPTPCGDQREMNQHDFCRELADLRCDSNFKVSHGRLGDDVVFAVALGLIAGAEAYANSVIRTHSTIYWERPKPEVAPGTLARRPYDKVGNTWMQTVNGNTVLYWVTETAVHYAIDSIASRREAYKAIYGEGRW